MSEPQQQSLALIPHTYEGQIVRQRSGDGYVNATALCTAAGKLFGHYYENDRTIEFVKELSSDIGKPITELVQIVRGGNPALQGTWVHPQVAIHLAQWLSPKFAVQVTQWVYEWLSGQLSPEQNAWQIFQERISLVYDSVPVGYFCIFKETSDVYASMIAGGAPLGAKMILDISIGIKWGAHWRENEFNQVFGERRTYPHNYPIRYPQSLSNPQQANCYPDAALPEFRRWMREDYLPAGFPAYLQMQIAKGNLAVTAANEAMLAIENREQNRARIR
ncbi:MAG: hypothetical protein JWP23_1060 [Phenylobacterium sp.]|nr:hypothetical protein [Phenylobacterium sp.]